MKKHFLLLAMLCLVAFLPAQANVGDKIEAEDYSANQGAQAETNASLSGTGNVGYVQNGTWIMFSGVSFSGNEDSISVLASGTTGGNIEIRTDSVDGALVGTVVIAPTTGWSDYQQYRASLAPQTGAKDLYLVFTGATGYLFNIDYMVLSGEAVSAGKTFTNLVAHYTFNESAGTVATDGVNGLNGTLHNLADGQWVEGLVGNALNFADGSDSSYVEIADDPALDFDSVSSFSISTVFTVGDISGGDMNLVWKGATGMNTPDEKGHWYSVFFKQNELRFAIDDNMTKSQLNYPMANLHIHTDGWNHVVGVRDLVQDSLFIYLNGEKVAAMADGTDFDMKSSPLPLIIGNNASRNTNFKGKIDDVQMYNRALTPVEIAELTASYSIDPVIYIPSNDASLTVLMANGVIVTGFDPATTSYTVTLPAGTVDVPGITAITTSEMATPTINYPGEVPGTCTIDVVAEDGSVVTYTVVFDVQDPKSNDAKLKELTLSLGELSPAFNPSETSYLVSLAEGTTSVDVTAMVNDAKATVVGAGTVDVSGTDPKVQITVTAEDQTTKTYTIVFTVTSGIEDLSASKHVVYDKSADALTLSGVGSVVVYTMNGIPVLSTIATDNYLSLSSIGKGIYVVRAIVAGKPLSVKIVK